MENKRCHLQMLQTVIARMASNSFLLKGWSVTLVSALFALAADKSNPCFVYLAYFPVLMFWVLDGFFLQQDRLFRKLYDHVRALSEENIDFSMETKPLSCEVENWLYSCLSSTLLTFHGTVLSCITLVMLILALSQ